MRPGADAAQVEPAPSGQVAMQDVMLWLEAPPWFWPLFIVAARVVDVTIGTLRMIIVVRGYRMQAAVLGFIEVVVWVTAVSGVLYEISVVKVIAYGAGFALGNVTGIGLEEWLALGRQRVILMSRGRTHSVAFALRLERFMVTSLPAYGGQGKIALCFSIVPRRRTREVIRVARAVDPDVIVVVEDVRHSDLGRTAEPTASTGWRAIMKKK